MPVFGSLNDIPLTDVLSIIGNNVGVLALSNLPPSREVALHLSDGKLTAFYDNGTPLHDGAWIRGSLATLFQSKKGEFLFLSAPLAKPEMHLGLSITHLLLDACGEAAQAQECREYFPSPDTLFSAVNATTENLDAELTGILHAFLRRPGAVASPAEVAVLVGVCIDQVLWCFHKLRAAKLIRPVRPLGAVRRTTRLVPDVGGSTVSASVDVNHPAPQANQLMDGGSKLTAIQIPRLRRVRPGALPNGVKGMAVRFTSLIR